MFQREDAELNLPDIYNRIGIGTMTWSPLASGILSGKYEDGVPVNSRASLKGCNWLKEKIASEDGKKKQAKVRELQSIADKLCCTMAQLSIGMHILLDSLDSQFRSIMILSSFFFFYSFFLQHGV